MDSLVNLLDASAGRTPHNPAIKLWSPKQTKSFSFQEIQSASRKMAALLKSHGLLNGNRVVIWGPNCPEWVIAFFGCLRIGAVAVPFDAQTDPTFLGRIMETTTPNLIIAGTEQRKNLSAVETPVLEMEQLLTKIELPTLQAEESINEMAEIVFTSGSTGNPKGVVLTHKNIGSNVEAILKIVRLTPEHRFLSVLPLSHMFEITVELLAPITSGSSITYMDSLRPDRIFQAMESEKITCMSLSPRVLQMFTDGVKKDVAQSGKQETWDKANRISPYLPMPLRRRIFKELHQKMGGYFDFFVVGGARLDPELGAFWERLGIKVLQGYGMTEASPVVSCDSLKKRVHTHAGEIIPGIEVKIAPDDEILVKGPNIMPGYWNDPEKTAEVIDRDGWYHTGDLGEKSWGRLRLFDRNKYLIALPSGLNVYPADVEMVLKRQPGVRDSVVSGKTDVRACLLLEKGIDPEVVVKTANRELAPHQRISHWKVWEGEDFPRNPKREPKREEIIRILES